MDRIEESPVQVGRQTLQILSWKDTTDAGGWDDRAALTALLADIRAASAG